MFVGLDYGLAVLHRGRSGWIGAGHVPGVEIEVWTIATAPDGTLWLGLEEGVAHVHFPDPSASGAEFDPQAVEVRIFGAAEGLPEGGLGVNRAGVVALGGGAVHPGVVPLYESVKQPADLSAERGRIYTITAYEPSLEHFEPDFKTRRSL